jgi:hypothetical protein
MENRQTSNLLTKIKNKGKRTQIFELQKYKNAIKKKYFAIFQPIL